MRIRQGMLGTVLLAALVLAPPTAADWVAELEARIERLDRQSPGELGLYVKHLGEDKEFSYQAERLWYLSSTVKVPVAVALLQKVEAGELSLADELTLQRSDYVDGAGDLLWHEPGTRFSLRTLLQKMIENSDSTAADMLIRLIGPDELNRRIQESMAPTGFTPFTSILQVRYDAYGLLHPGVAELSNMDFIRLKNAAPGEPRLRALAATLSVPAARLRLDSIEDAFERYYERELNSGRLDAYGGLLERLAEGDLLSQEHTELLLSHMQRITTGDSRIKAGLPKDVPFAQKTGTQVSRACNVGILRPGSPSRAVVVTACVEKHDAVAEAEAALAGVGEALRASGVLR